MQAIVETLFDTVYLFSVITIGILMIRKSKGNRQFTMFGIMAVILGSGDAFHLVPRATALCTTGLENFTVQLGLGKWITSVTMTIFYVVLYHIWRERYQIKGYKAATAAIYGLAGLRIVLCYNKTTKKWLSLFSLPCSQLILSKHMHRFLESSACRSSELHQPAVQPEYRMQSSGQLSATSNEKSYRYFLLHFYRIKR